MVHHSTVTTEPTPFSHKTMFRHRCLGFVFLVLVAVSNVLYRVPFQFDRYIVDLSASAGCSTSNEYTIRNSSLTNNKKAVRTKPVTKSRVIIFLHLFKTGGTTIRLILLRNYKFVKMQRAKDYLSFYNATQTVDSYLTKQVAGTFFLELHIEYPAPGYPTLFTLEPYLQHWRQLSQLNKVDLIAFTILRQPLPFAVSYFNQFNAFPFRSTWNPYNQERCNSTEENFVRTFVPNRQCLLLASDPDGVPHTTVTPELCQRAQEILRNEFDWVGTAETLEAETLPLVFQWIGRPQPRTFPQVNTAAKRTNHLTVSQLSSSTVEMVRNNSILDQQLYDSMVEAFHSASKK